MTKKIDRSILSLVMKGMGNFEPSKCMKRFWTHSVGSKMRELTLQLCGDMG